MKKIISVISLIAIICSSFAACKNNPDDVISGPVTSEVTNMEQKPTSSENTKSEQVLGVDKVLDKNNQKPLNEIITTAYPQNELLRSLDFFSSDNFNTMIQELDKKYPIECLRLFDDMSLPYCVYKLKESGYAFLFFHGDQLLFLDFVFVVKEPLSKTNFDVITQGDTMSKVYEVDNGLKVLNEAIPGYLHKKRTYHMVKEGFILIEYDVDNFTEEIDATAFKVKSVNFFANGSLVEGLNYNEWDIDNPSPFAYSFLAQDYPEMR